MPFSKAETKGGFHLRGPFLSCTSIVILENTGDFESVLHISIGSKSLNCFVLKMWKTEA